MLSKNEIKHIAELARIGLNEKEIEKYRKDLSAVLDYFKKLEEIDTENVEPVGHITETLNIAREDREKEFSEAGKKKIIKNMPETKEGYLKVKSVL